MSANLSHREKLKAAIYNVAMHCYGDVHAAEGMPNWGIEERHDSFVLRVDGQGYRIPTTTPVNDRLRAGIVKALGFHDAADDIAARDEEAKELRAESARLVEAARRYAEEQPGTTEQVDAAIADLGREVNDLRAATLRLKWAAEIEDAAETRRRLAMFDRAVAAYRRRPQPEPADHMAVDAEANVARCEAACLVP
jgi:hypothetical protein